MGPGVRMKQLAWRDKVSIETVLCRLRFGPGRGDSKVGERKACDPPMSVSLTNEEWNIALGAKRESEAAEAAAVSVQRGGGQQCAEKEEEEAPQVTDLPVERGGNYATRLIKKVFE